MPGGKRVGTEIDDPGEFAQFDPRRAVAGVHDAIVDDVEFAGCRLQDGGRDIENVLAQDLRRLKRGLAADAGAARGPGAAAIGRVVGIAENDADAIHRDAEHAADDLGGERFRALPLLGDAGLADHRALRVQPHRDAVLRRYPGAADAVKGRAGIGDLDEAGDADAAMDVSASQGRLFGAQRVVVHHRRSACPARHDATTARSASRTAKHRDRRHRRSDCGGGSRPDPCRSSSRPDRPGLPSPSTRSDGRRARYWHITFLFWNTTRARAR